MSTHENATTVSGNAGMLDTAATSYAASPPVGMMMRMIGMSAKPQATTGGSAVRPDALPVIHSPLRNLDVEAVNIAARAETRNREVHLPPISTYRWWARRTAAVNRAIISAVSQDSPGILTVVDPFAGGGVIALSALIEGHRVYAQDLNPWAAKGLATMIGLPAAEEIREAAAVIEQWVATQIHALYGTSLSDGTPAVASHTFRVATGECTRCGNRSRMFPHALVTLLRRKEHGGQEAWLACPNGHLFQGDVSGHCRCSECQMLTDPAIAYTPRRQVRCACGRVDSLSDRAQTWEWEVVLVERTAGHRRELALPTQAELTAAQPDHWRSTQSLGSIPDGQETKVLRRHGFTSWDELYPLRQRYVTERLLEAASHCSQNPAVVNAVTMAVLGTVEMAGHLSRWDRYYLKSYEAMARHRFNLTTLAVEPYVWGAQGSGRGTLGRRLRQLIRAAEWLAGNIREHSIVEGPLASSGALTTFDADVRVVEGSSERMLLPAASVELVLTDPPYHDDVQYSELSLPLRAWGQLGDKPLDGEAVVNDATGQLTGLGAYEDLLHRIFAEARRVLRPDGHLIFSYANRSPAAWSALFAALQASGLRAVGCEIVHSENETDYAKRGVRSCSLDLIMDLVPVGSVLIQPYTPQTAGTDDEISFLHEVAQAFMRVGGLSGDWRAALEARLYRSEFLCR